MASRLNPSKYRPGKQKRNHAQWLGLRRAARLPPTHQLFFSSPAVYLVVWKPREGSQAGLVKEWIELVKHREPEAKILVVATHGGPQQRQPDIDRQEFWDLFGKDTVIDFFFVDSKPDEMAIARHRRTQACHCPRGLESARSGTFRAETFAGGRQALQNTAASLSAAGDVLGLCRSIDG